MTIREAERVIVVRAKRLAATCDENVTAHGMPRMLEDIVALRDAVRDLEDAEKGARFAAKRHTEGGDW